jgi:hypothetical protein
MSDEATGMSAAERDVRRRVEQHKDVDAYLPMKVEIGVLRTLLRDIAMWRRLARDNGREMDDLVDCLSFDDLVAMAKRMLDTVYPDDIFVRDENKIAEIAQVVGGNSGVHFVVLLRWLIAVIEAPSDGRLYADHSAKLARDTPRLGDSDADIEVIARIIAGHVFDSDGDGVVVLAIDEALRAAAAEIIELIRQNRGIRMRSETKTLHLKCTTVIAFRPEASDHAVVAMIEGCTTHDEALAVVKELEGAINERVLKSGGRIYHPAEGSEKKQ